MCLTTKAPSIAPIKVKGNSLETNLKFTFPDRINEMVLISDPIELASLLVAIAVEGGRPVNNKAGIEINPPPPTTESIKAAKNLKQLKNIV